MQYVGLIYQGSTPLPGSAGWEAMTEAEQRSVYADYAALNQTPGLTPGLPLGLAERATTVRVADGHVVASDGPYLGDAARAVGGWFVLEADSVEAAIEIAARVPAARLGGAVEVRPAETYW